LELLRHSTVLVAQHTSITVVVDLTTTRQPATVQTTDAAVEASSSTRVAKKARAAETVLLVRMGQPAKRIHQATVLIRHYAPVLVH
jgi:hypothetical protein